MRVTDVCKLETINGGNRLENSLSLADGYEAYCENGQVDVFGKIKQGKKIKEGKTKYIVYCLSGRSIIR